MGSTEAIFVDSIERVAACPLLGENGVDHVIVLDLSSGPTSFSLCLRSDAGRTLLSILTETLEGIS